MQTELIALRQDHAEPIRQFHARAWGKARSCELKKTFECDQVVNFSDHIVKMVLVNRIYDEEIKQQVLGEITLDEATLKETICLIEAKERAARLVAGNSATSAVRTLQPRLLRHLTGRYFAQINA